MPAVDRARYGETPVPGAALRAQLRHAYWIGGGSSAGKSVIAGAIAARRGLRLYATDDMMPDHASRSTPEDRPCLRAFAAMDMDERWVNRNPETMLRTFQISALIYNDKQWSAFINAVKPAWAGEHFATLEQ